MDKKTDICKNCAYAAVRTDATRFAWCKYFCTFPADDEGRHIAYKYETDSCVHFVPTEKPKEN